MASGIEYIRYGETTPETFSKVLIDKVLRAGNRGIVQIAGGVFDTSNAINLPNVQVTIRGAGKWRTTIRLLQKSSRQGGPGFINVGSNGTVFQNLRVDCKYGMLWMDGSCAINTNSFSDVTVQDAEIRNSGIGIGTPDNETGLIPHGLTVSRTIFVGCKHGIHWNRVMSKSPAQYVKKISITECKFTGEQIAGISIDAGNDGLDGNPNLQDARSQLGMDTVTNMCDMEIKWCTFEKARKYNVALAKVWNVNIIGNHFKGAHAEYGESINIEHSAYDILVEGNKFTGGSRQWEQHHISILTFKDYEDTRRAYFNCDPARFYEGDGCRLITIRQNDFRGNVWSFVRGEFARQVSVVANRTNYFGNIREKFSFAPNCSEIYLQ